MERPVCDATGARRVHVFDHNVRNAERAGDPGSGVQSPVLFAHNDYALGSGPQRVRDLLPDEADALLGQRFSGPVQRNPLGFCDAQSITPDDLIASGRTPDRA